MQQKDCRISRQSRLALCMVINVPKNLPLRTSCEECGNFPAMRRGRCLHRPGGTIRFEGKFRRIRNFPRAGRVARTYNLTGVI